MRTLLSVAATTAAYALSDRYDTPAVYAGTVTLVSSQEAVTAEISLASGPVVVQLGGAAVQQQAA